MSLVAVRKNQAGVLGQVAQLVYVISGGGLSKLGSTVFAELVESLRAVPIPPAEVATRCD
jgi:hypothetical protein